MAGFWGVIHQEHSGRDLTDHEDNLSSYNDSRGHGVSEWKCDLPRVFQHIRARTKTRPLTSPAHFLLFLQLPFKK